MFLYDTVPISLPITILVPHLRWNRKEYFINMDIIIELLKKLNSVSETNLDTTRPSSEKYKLS